jgi:DNA-binding LytR/AlgR family response regulator
VIYRYIKEDSIMTDFEKETPDVYLINCRLPANKNEIDVAIQISNKFPSAPILFVTPDEHQCRETSKNPIFYDKNIDVLLKPVKLDQIESSILNLVNKK